MKYSTAIRATALALALAPSACDSGGESAADAAPVSAACAEATTHSDLAWIQENIFDRSCAFSGSCHGGESPAGSLDLEAGASEAALVDQPAVSEGLAGQTLVIPGDAEASYLMIIIDHESLGGRLAGPLPRAGAMPYNSPLICVEKRDAIARWIESL